MRMRKKNFRIRNPGTNQYLKQQKSDRWFYFCQYDEQTIPAPAYMNNGIYSGDYGAVMKDIRGCDMYRSALPGLHDLKYDPLTEWNKNRYNYIKGNWVGRPML